MAEFIQSARNFIFSDNKEDYFYPIEKNLNKQDILNEFKKRNSDLIAFRFNIPDMPLDTLHPQLRKTCESLERKLNDKEFNVFKADYWSDEIINCVILLEMASSKLNDVEINKGPKVFINKACENFAKKYGRENCYVQDDYLVHMQKREFVSATDFISHIFTKEHINLIKVGKNLRNNLINTFEFIDVEDIDLEFRLSRCGIYAMSRKCQLVQFHCFHKHFDTNYAPNKALLQENNDKQITYTPYGIKS
jgi:tRNA nucleotidyltransferase (CCA-adding enzyme)